MTIDDPIIAYARISVDPLTLFQGTIQAYFGPKKWGLLLILEEFCDISGIQDLNYLIVQEIYFFVKNLFFWE